MFDRDGRLLASDGGSDADGIVPDIATSTDLAASLRGVDGRPIDLADLAPGLPVPVVDRLGRELDLTIDPVAGHDLAGPATVVSLVATSDAPEAIVQRALGGVLAHELRTPLTTIYGGAQLIADPGSPDAVRSEAAAAVAREAQRLLDVIEDLVVLARFEDVRGADLEPVLLQRLLPPVIGSERIARAGVTIETDLPADLPAVLASPRHAEHAFRNLLVAAIRTGPGGAPVRVRAGAAHDRVEVEVSDEGPTPSDEDAGRAFELFARSPRTGGDPSGVNLALFVARRLVAAMGGVTWLSGRPGGARAGFSLAIADGAPSRRRAGR